MKTETKIGKYTVIHDNGVGLHLLRNDILWMDTDEVQLSKFVLAAAAEIDMLREQLEEERYTTRRFAAKV